MRLFRVRPVFIGLALAALCFGCTPEEAPIRCGAGTVRSSGVCVPTGGIVCGSGTALVGDQCVPAAEGVECGAGTALVAGECVPSDPLACGDGTERVGDVCVSADGDLRCGPGTELRGDECVAPDGVVCGEGTRLEDGACVLEAVLCPDGQGWVGGRCVPIGARCGAGTVQVGDACVPVDPLADIAAEESAENNDPVLGGAAGALALGDEGSLLYVRGLIQAPRDLDDDGLADADFDGFAVSLRGGDRVSIEVTAVGAPDLAFEVTGPNGYWRRAFPATERNARRILAVPADGSYLLRISTAVNFAGGAPPQGGDSFTWFAAVGLVAAGEAAVYDRTDFLWDARADSAPAARIAVSAASPIRLSVSGAPDAQPVLLVAREGGFDEVDAAQPRVFFVPEGGLEVVADQRITGSGRAVIVRADAGGARLGRLGPGEDLALTGTAIPGGEGPAWSWEVEAGTVVRVDGDPGVQMVLQQTAPARTVEAQERIELAVWEPGAFTLVVHGAESDVNLRVRTWAVTSIGSLAVGDGLVRVRTPELLSPSTVYTTVSPTEPGLVTLGVRPPEGLDANLSVFRGDVIAAQTLSPDALVATATGPGGYELVSDIVEGPERLLVRVEAVEGGGRPTLEARLETALMELEPNDSADQAQRLPDVVNGLLVSGRLEPADIVTDDFYAFRLSGPSRIAVRSSAPGLQPSSGVELALWDGATQRPLLTAPSSPQIPFAQLEATVPAGEYLVRVRAPEGAEGGGYLVRVSVLRDFVCLPGSEVCVEGAVGLCGPGGEGYTTVACAQDLECAELDDVPGCGQTLEVEPNDLLARAQPLGQLAPGRTDVRASAAHDSDADFFTVELREGGVANIGTLAAGGAVTTQITVYSAQGERLAEDDGSGPEGHALIERLAVPAGTYTVAVQPVTGTGPYRLYFDVRALACPVGQRRCAEDVLEHCDGLVFGAVETCALGCVPGDPAACREPPPPREDEPNDSPELAFILGALPVTVQGRIEPGDDVDWYQLDTVGQGVLLLGTSDPDTGDPVNTRLFLCSTADVENNCAWLGPRTARNDDGEGRDGYSYLEVQVDAGTWWLAVESFGPDTGDYLVTVALGPLPGEPNENWRDATALGPERPARFAIDVPGDQDWYVVDVGETATVRVETGSVGQLGRDVDTRVFVCEQLDPDRCSFGDEGAHLAANDDGPGLGGYSRIDVALPGPGRYFVVVEAFGEQVGDYELVVTDVFEPNDGPGQTSPIEVPSLSHGVLDGSEDWYETLVVFVGETHTFTTAPWGGRGAVDTRLRLVRLSDPGTTIVDNDDAEGLGVFSRLRYTFDAPGEYAVVVSSSDDQARGGYLLQAEAEF